MDSDSQKPGTARSGLSGFISFRAMIITAVYTVIISLSLVLAYLLRFDFTFSHLDNFDILSVLPYVILIKLAFLAAFGQYKGLLSFFHIPDIIKIFWAMTLSAAVIMVASQLERHTFVPRGVILGDYIISIIIFSLLRLGMRVYRERMMQDSDTGKHAKRVVIIGAGDIGTSLAADLLARKNLGIIPVLFLDDDPKKWGRQILGLEVLPLESNIETIVHGKNIDRAIIAIANVPGTKIAKITTAFRKIGIETSIVPSYHDLASGRARVSNLREIDIEDILGRDPIKLDSNAIDKMLLGKTVMVTGAGGSIGRELCRQVASKSPALLVMVEQSEVQLFQIEQEMIECEYGSIIKPLVGSVGDEKRMDNIVRRYEPDIIFHAAAHKHVPMMESQPSEALKNNTLGTWTLASVASRNRVKKFVLISTDKAINPTNVMGASKRLAEKVIQAMQRRPENTTQFVAVRFGNVLGSSGSVIPTFKRQIANGGPVTVTHPEVTRYFMTIPEAVGLVLQCGAQAHGGEIFVLDMGKPVKIIDLARQMIRLSGFNPDTDMPIKIIGLRPGEKLYEELQHKNESLVKTAHPRIFGFVSDPPTFEEMKKFTDTIRSSADKKSVNELKKLISTAVPEYKPQFYD